ncbi:DNA-binding transcriptional regulator, AcrR family [Nonomuraea maritima]|uniref:DNA-binding transcriptional regulator, AcrR family n=1 Tax=Nonomuraea maritima TaxID=683260 RepID=A0A1G9EJX2_9ACTN|nr:TetR/AcrR family transcriptional regulator [Nonomuraea maritima]SDK76436.1 DNA-binding transcriptional regulator, AcrR family [Nonomuraea maritima]
MVSAGDGRTRQDRGTTPRRGDAERNIAAILTAAFDVLSTDPAATMADVARAAGVGRVTLYAHFSSRAELLQALVQQALEETRQLLEDALAVDRPADQVLAGIIHTSWRTLDRHRRIRRVALAELGSEWVAGQHDQVFLRLTDLLARGRDQGVFRSDLPLSWMTTTVYGLLHAAADEVDTGRVSSADAPHLIISSLLPALAG